MSGLASWLLLLIFVASAAVIWGAGIALSDTTDVLSERWHLGSALGGLIMLAVATNLPEIAITVSAALSRRRRRSRSATSSAGSRSRPSSSSRSTRSASRPRKPLTYLAASLTLVLEGALVVAVLLVVVMGTQLPNDLRVPASHARCRAHRGCVGRGPAPRPPRRQGAALARRAGDAPDSQDEAARAQQAREGAPRPASGAGAPARGRSCSRGRARDARQRGDPGAQRRGVLRPARPLGGRSSAPPSSRRRPRCRSSPPA